MIEGNNFSDNTETNEDGFFTFENVLSANYTLTFEKEDYETQIMDITLGEGEVKKTASSDEDGFFEFTDLKADTYIIFAKKKKYRNTQRKVKLGDSESKEIEIVMKKTSKRVKEMIEDGQE